ncbi:MAG: hypothetical protein IRZ14_13925 [Chloroflexi bacterium]|nr:hypothetical protein [Chloroflexota bacterium]
MGETAADTAREIAVLRRETERLLDALERRARASLDVRQQVLAHPALPLVVAGAGAVLGVTVLALWYRSYRRARAARRPLARLQRGVEAFGTEALTRARLAGQALRGEEPVREAAPPEPPLRPRLLRALAAGATLAGSAYLARKLAEPQWRTEPPQPPPQAAPAS